MKSLLHCNPQIAGCFYVCATIYVDPKKTDLNQKKFHLPIDRQIGSMELLPNENDTMALYANNKESL